MPGSLPNIFFVMSNMLYIEKQFERYIFKSFTKIHKKMLDSGRHYLFQQNGPSDTLHYAARRVLLDAQGVSRPNLKNLRKHIYVFELFLISK